jgi:hypothetical protein
MTEEVRSDVKVSGADAPATEAVQVQAPAPPRPSLNIAGKEYTEWAEIGMSLRAEHEKNEGGIAWQAAQWLVDGYQTFVGHNPSNQEKGRLIKHASRITGLSRNTLITYIRVGFAFPNGPMDSRLGFAHHRAVISIPHRDDRAYWLRQAAANQMSVSNLKQAIKPLLPVKPKLGINGVKEAQYYASRLEKLNPKDRIWSYIISDIGGGRSLDYYRELQRAMTKSADVLFLNLKQLDGALAGRPAATQAVQEYIKPKELEEAEQLEAIGSDIGVAA